MVAAGSDAFSGAATLGEWSAALDKANTAREPKVWIGPRTRKEFFFSMTMLANRVEYVRFAAMWHRRADYLALLEEEAAEQDKVETIRLTRAFTVSASPREVYGRRRA